MFCSTRITWPILSPQPMDLGSPDTAVRAGTVIIFALELLGLALAALCAESGCVPRENGSPRRTDLPPPRNACLAPRIGAVYLFDMRIAAFSAPD